MLIFKCHDDSRLNLKRILSEVCEGLNSFLRRDISKRAGCHPGGPEDVPQEEKEEAGNIGA